MSDGDSFIEEVSEEVRRDRLFALWRRWGAYVIGVIVLAVAGAGAKTWMDRQAEANARSAGAAMIAASEAAPGEAAAALEALADESGSEGAAMLARLRAAGALAAEGKPKEAAAAYQKTADEAEDPLFRDFAAFRAVMVVAPTMPPSAQVDALKPLAEGAGPFRLLAMEARGVALYEAGDRDAAIDALRAVSDDANAPQGARQRVQAMLTAIGATPEAEG